MICVECTNSSIKELYATYRSEYIQLTRCPRCGNIADKYSEYDNVITFLDILLLKKQAYRHLAVNVTEEQLILGTQKYLASVDLNSRKDNVSSVKLTGFRGLKYFLTIYEKLVRFVLITLLFEVYLTWAHVEKQQADQQLMSMALVLQETILLQYCYFIFQVLLSNSIFYCSLLLVILRIYQWKVEHITVDNSSQKLQNLVVIFTTIAVSASVKLFPILTLIWPYDTTVYLPPILILVSIFYVVEALRVVTMLPFSKILLGVGISSLFLYTLLVLVSRVAISVYFKVLFQQLVLEEWNALSSKYNYQNII